AVTRARIGHLRANLFNARLLTRSTLLRRQCDVVGFRVTGALDLVVGVESRFAVTRQVTRGWQALKSDRDKPLILLARPKRFELLTPVVWCSIGRVLDSRLIPDDGSPPRNETMRHEPHRHSPALDFKSSRLNRMRNPILWWLRAA